MGHVRTTGRRRGRGMFLQARRDMIPRGLREALLSYAMTFTLVSGAYVLGFACQLPYALPMQEGAVGICGALSDRLSGSLASGNAVQRLVAAMLRMLSRPPLACFSVAALLGLAVAAGIAVARVAGALAWMARRRTETVEADVAGIGNDAGGHAEAFARLSGTGAAESAD